MLVCMLLEGNLGFQGSMGAEDPEAQKKRMRVFRHMRGHTRVERPSHDMIMN